MNMEIRYHPNPLIETFYFKLDKDDSRVKTNQMPIKVCSLEIPPISEKIGFLNIDFESAIWEVNNLMKIWLHEWGHVKGGTGGQKSNAKWENETVVNLIQNPAFSF